MHPAVPIVMVFVGCCSNVVFLELLVRDAPGCGNIVTFAQFLLIAVEGFVFTSKFGTKKSVIPMSHLHLMTAMYIVNTIFQIMLYHLRVSIPLQMMLRSGSLIANLILGVIILKKSYKLSKYVSVMMITVGIAMATIASAQDINGQNGEAGSEEKSMQHLFRWLIGIGMLTFALFMSARMGIYQEEVYSKFGKHPSEALFYNHALPLPIFLLVYADIWNHILIFNQSEPLTLPLIGMAFPKMWVYLVGDILTQYVCIRSVFILTTECASLTVTLVITLRKFVSLLFSIMYFQNPFTAWHWLGTVLVFGGTLLFTEIFQRIYRVFVPEKIKEE